MDLAAREDIWLQYTGVDNRAEVAHVVDLLKAKGLSPLRLWGENSGMAPDVLLPVDIVLSYGLWGIDYTHTSHLFKDDHITPGPRFPDLKAGMTALSKRQRLDTWKQPAVERKPLGELEEGRQRIRFTVPCAADARLIKMRPDAHYGSEERRLAALGGANEQHALLQFDIPQDITPDARIESAELRLVREKPASRAGILLQLRALAQAWKEFEVSWDSPDGAHSWARPGGTTVAAPAIAANCVPESGTNICRFDVTPLVKAWCAGSLPNHGLIIEVPEHSKGAAYFYSRDSRQAAQRPVLEVICAMPATARPAR